MPLSMFLPLRIAVPLFVAIVFSGLAIAHGLLSYYQLSSDLQRDVVHHIRTVMGMMQRSANAGYRLGNVERVGADLSQLSLDRFINRVVLTDADGRLLLGAGAGGKESELLSPAFVADIADEVTSSGVSQVASCLNGRQLCGYFRVNLYTPNPGALRGDYGLLYLEYDLERRMQQELGQILIFLSSLVASILLAAALLWLFLHHVVTRRVDDLQYAAQIISNGDFSARSRVSGSDELGRLAGEINKMAGFIQQRQAQLEANERRYRLIFNNAGDAMFVHFLEEHGAPGCFIEVNDYACQMLGYSREELLQLSPTELDAPHFAEGIPGVTEQLQRDAHVVFTTSHRRKGGGSIPVEVSSHLFEYQGRPMVLSIARSLTSRKELERSLHHFKATLDMTSDRVLMFDQADYRVIYANRGTMKALSSTLTELEALTVFTVFPGLDQEWLESGLESLCQGERETLRFEAEFSAGDGNSYPIDVSLQHVALPGDGGRFVMIARDITEQKRIRLELASANRALRTLSSCNMVLIKSRDERQLLQDICDAVVREGGLHALLDRLRRAYRWREAGGAAGQCRYPPGLPAECQGSLG